MNEEEGGRNVHRGTWASSGKDLASRVLSKLLFSVTQVNGVD